MQAIKIAGATPHVVAHLRTLNATRRRTAVKDKVFYDLIDGVGVNVVQLATGAILLLAAGKMRSGTFTIGDFALFVTYLTQFAWFPLEITRVLRGYVQTGRVGGAHGDGARPRGRQPPADHGAARHRAARTRRSASGVRAVAHPARAAGAARRCGA